jgi:hypothetical protein
MSGTVTRMPVPMGVVAETGETHPALTEDTLPPISPDPPAARKTRSRGVDPSVVDNPNELSEAGWCLLLPSDADPAIGEALQPLIDLRRSQVGNDQLFQVFEGPRGVAPKQSAAAWATGRNVSLSAPVNPLKGVPYYMLIAGPPSRISFDFQAQLDLGWAVGRLAFDNVEDYASYAQKVVEYEKGNAPKRKKRTAVWVPRNPLDVATPLLAGSIVPEFLGELTPGTPPIGKARGFELSTFVGDGQATKARLLDIIRGNRDVGPPALLFTGSHGVEWSIDDPVVQRERQGAIVTQEWTRGKPLEEAHYFAASDVPADAQVHGMIMFLFACFGGGCPDLDTYYFTNDGARIPLAREPMVARLPQALLSRGALAVIAHVDRAFSYAFEDVMGTPQAQLLRSPLELLAKGRRVGLAAEPLNLHWSALAAQLGMALGGNAPGAPPRGPLIANLFIARDDARNYTVLGDPAVRLISEMLE